MKHIGIMALLLLLAAGVGEVTAQTQADSTNVSNDSITWNKELEGIEIKAQRQLIKQEIDRIGYDVQADEESKTLTVMDMLRKVPMVTVDGEDNIKVKGNSGFKIYKNGRYDPSLTKNAKEVLKAMPASMVKRIEVITDPGAREDAEGVNAILNIVMVDGRRIDGVTGSVTGAYTTLNHPNLGAYLTTQMGKAIVSVDYGYGGMSSKETENKSGSQKLPWKLRLTAYTYGEMGHSVNNVYSYSRPWNRYGCSLQRSFLSEDRLTVRISANDFFVNTVTISTAPLKAIFLAIATAQIAQA